MTQRAQELRQAEFDIMFAQGISKIGELIDLGVDKRVIERSGAWYSYNGERIGQGRDAAREFLKSNPDAALEVEAKLRALADVPGRDGKKANEKDEKPAAGKPEKSPGRSDEKRAQR